VQVLIALFARRFSSIPDKNETALPANILSVKSIRDVFTGAVHFSRSVPCGIPRDRRHRGGIAAASAPAFSAPQEEFFDARREILVPKLNPFFQLQKVASLPK